MHDNHYRAFEPEVAFASIQFAPAPNRSVATNFGMAKVLATAAGVTDSLTQAGAVMGTFGYMAPEVFTGGPVDERADIFAIGVMVVETLVGERPFGGQTPHEVLTTLLHSEYHLPGESIEIRALDAVVQRCRAKDPRDRYGSATELSKELVPTIARCAGFEARHCVTIPDTPALG